MARRFTEEHPLTKKTRLLEKFMDDNGISLEWDGIRLNVRDTDTGTTAAYRDSEGGEHLTEFPNMFESKLTVED